MTHAEGDVAAPAAAPTAHHHHSHAHSHPRAAGSLLGASVLLRLAIVAAVTAALWIAIVWAMA